MYWILPFTYLQTWLFIQMKIYNLYIFLQIINSWHDMDQSIFIEWMHWIFIFVCSWLVFNNNINRRLKFTPYEISLYSYLPCITVYHKGTKISHVLQSVFAFILTLWAGTALSLSHKSWVTEIKTTTSHILLIQKI